MLIQVLHSAHIPLVLTKALLSVLLKEKRQLPPPPPQTKKGINLTGTHV